MTPNLAPSSATRMQRLMIGRGRFATLTFETGRGRAVVGAVGGLDGPGRAGESGPRPSPSVTVEFLEADTRVGGREVSLCKVRGPAGHPLRDAAGWRCSRRCAA